MIQTRASPIRQESRGRVRRAFAWMKERLSPRSNPLDDHYVEHMAAWSITDEKKSDDFSAVFLSIGRCLDLDSGRINDRQDYRSSLVLWDMDSRREHARVYHLVEIFQRGKEGDGEAFSQAYDLRRGEEITLAMNIPMVGRIPVNKKVSVRVKELAFVVGITHFDVSVSKLQ